MALVFNSAESSLEYLKTSVLPSYTSYSICGWGRVKTARGAKAVIHHFVAYTIYGYTDISLDSSNNLVIQDATNLSSAILTGMSANTEFFWCLSAGAIGAGGLTGYAAKEGDSALSSLSVSRTSADGAAGNFSIGGSEYNEYFDGALDNVIIYDSVLTAAEVYAQWRRRLPIKTPWAWYPMVYPQTISDNYTDRSGNARNLTLNAGTLTFEDGCKVGYGAALSFINSPAGTSAPTLSLPGVQDIAATSVRPKVTLTF